MPHRAVAAVLCLLVASGSAFLPPHDPQSLGMRLLSAVDETTLAEKVHTLPPGRPIHRFLSIFFDDTNRFLHSRGMSTYQIKRREKFGCIFRTNLFLRPAVVVTDKKAMNQIWTYELNNTMPAVVPPHHQGISGAHTLFCNWIKPSLASKKVATHQMTMELQVDNFLHDLKKKHQRRFVKLVPLVRAFFISMTLQMFMGTLHLDHDLSQEIQTWAQSSVANPLAIFPWRIPAKAKRARKRILNHLVDIAEHDRHADDPVTLIGKVLHKALDTEDIIDRMLTTCFVGADSTASAAISVWRVLSTETDVKTDLRLYPEYIPTFVTNILQTYPPAPFGMRQVKQELEVGNYTIPSDWFIVFGLAGALHAEELPHDWLTLERNVASWVFGGGPHRCPGRYLASHQLVAWTRVLVQMDWQHKKRQNLKLHYSPGLFPVSGLKIRFPKEK